MTFQCSKLNRYSQIRATACLAVLLVTSWSCAADGALSPNELARAILERTEVNGGMVVHVGCGDGRLTAALRVGDAYIVQGLDRDSSQVETARACIRQLGLQGSVSAVHWKGGALPYVDNLANLIVSERPSPMDEVMRVLAPGGVAYIKQQGNWAKTVKAWPRELDEWTHALHDASNNAVADDTVVGPPRRMQWVGSPRYGRHHDHMSSVSAVVSEGGRMYYIFDEAPPISILLPPMWTLIARDAFNGSVLWKRRMGGWQDHLWRLKSGPAQLIRRLVATEGRVYATLALRAPVTALDAATGETVRTYEDTADAEEIIVHDGVLFAVVNNIPAEPGEAERMRRRGIDLPGIWDEAPKVLKAVREESGEVLWTSGRRILPGTLAADSRCVVFHDGECVVCLDRTNGNEFWRSQAVARCAEIPSFYLPTLVLYEDVVLCAGGETAGKQKGSWYEHGTDTMTALSAQTGEVLWSAYHPPSGYRSPEDLLVADGLVWTGETTSGRVVGTFTGRDPHTGEVKREFEPDVDTYWFHHRCYRGKATPRFLLMSRTGTEFIDVREEHWDINHWVRGACLYGVMPANGLLYAPQHPCACYQESKLTGLNALAPEPGGARIPQRAADLERLEIGCAFAQTPSETSAKGDWATYRHDAARSGRASTSVPTALEQRWQRDVGGRLSSPVVAGGRLFVASVEAHTVHALDAGSGEALWRYTAGGRVDSPPTVYAGLVLFGCADGYVYALRAHDGALAWRFLAAPMDQRLMAFEQIESVWPVHGSVLVQNDVLYCVAGRSMFLDEGLRLWRLDPATGGVLSESVLDTREASTGKDLQEFISWLNMPTALPDVLSSDGRYVYMRSQPFRLDGHRLPLQAMPRGSDADRGAPPPTQDRQYAHLFSPTGFLDASSWHRSYWMYGSTFVSGWCGYYLSGKVAPAGRILVFDDARVYGFGRLPKYYKWTTPIEHHLFAADKFSPTPVKSVEPSAQLSVVRIEKSQSLRCAGKPITVAAWVKASRRGGVVLARGGGAQGYALYVRNGHAHFAVRSNGSVSSVRTEDRLGDDTLFVAGPPDTIDEEQAYSAVNTPEVQEQLAAYGSALSGREGARLCVTSAASGEQVAAYELGASPVFDGLAAAGGRLYLSLVDGKVLCMSGS